MRQFIAPVHCASSSQILHGEGAQDAPAGRFQRRDPALDIGNGGGQFRVRAIIDALAVIAD
ncbi:hypothetical protein KY389_14445 [Paracoccus bogoriensis]|nr:hypothetical protein [Paracoccus bogoriensis]